MSHNIRCADASTQIDECDCDCEKMLHGVNKFRHPINFNHENSVIEGVLTKWSDEFLSGIANNDSQHSDMQHAKYVVEFAGKKLIEFETQNRGNWSAVSGALNSAYTELVDNLTGMAADKIASLIIDESSEPKGEIEKVREQTRLVIKYKHLVCVICVVLLEFYKDVDEITDEMAQKLASNIVDSVVEKIEKDRKIRIKERVKDVVKKILEYAIKKLFKTLTTKMKEIAIPLPWGNELALRIIGVSSCPDPEKHFEVMKYCLKPLIEECLKDPIKDRLSEDMKVFFDSVLKRIEQIEASQSHAQVTVS